MLLSLLFLLLNILREQNFHQFFIHLRFGSSMFFGLSDFISVFVIFYYYISLVVVKSPQAPEDDSQQRYRCAWEAHKIEQRCKGIEICWGKREQGCLHTATFVWQKKVLLG